MNYLSKSTSPNANISCTLNAFHTVYGPTCMRVIGLTLRLCIVCAIDLT